MVALQVPPRHLHATKCVHNNAMKLYSEDRERKTNFRVVLVNAALSQSSNSSERKYYSSVHLAENSHHYSDSTMPRIRPTSLGGSSSRSARQQHRSNNVWWNNSTLWLSVCALVVLVGRTTPILSTLGHKVRRWKVRRSRRGVKRLRAEMDRIIDHSNNNHRMIDVCFISSIFAEDLEHADKPGDVSSVWLDQEYSKKNIETTFRFFLFTNLHDMPVSNGWHKIVKTQEDLPYRRFITQSRWPKFMGWKDEHLQRCQTIFYFDGHYQVTPDNMWQIPRVAQELRNSPHGLAQMPHQARRTALAEFSRILLKHKDIASNVEASVKWLQSQPDFDNRCTLYQNSFFGYDPQNPTWQAAAEFFWSRYSLEVDSWRDQPLWCYTLQHIGLTQPLLLKQEGAKGLFQKDSLRTGHNGHQYDDQADGVKMKEALMLLPEEDGDNRSSRSGTTTGELSSSH